MHRRVCVLGLGYIGLPTASFLATKGYEVLGVDVEPRVVETINRAEIHIREPDLDILVKSAVQSGRLKAALEPEPADVFVIAVPTPLQEDKRADLSAVRSAVAAIAPHVRPGPGVGGHCIAVDPWFIVSHAAEEARLIRTAREVNDAKPEWVIQRVRQKAARFRRPAIACLGLAFKADVDDLRESPALRIVRRLREEDLGELLVCEPHVRGFDEFPLVPLEEAVERADIVLLLVDHRAFRRLKPAKLQEKVLIDTRGMWR
jgi:UDP-N-acetyl-D-mannosaminuronate dehydrogenase